jgi:hypothetical protein
MELLEIVENRELTQRLLDINDSMNNHFLRYTPKQCCGAGTGTAGTVNFCFRGTETGFGSGSNI